MAWGSTQADGSKKLELGQSQRPDSKRQETNPAE
jgi:hypothetical protein